MPTNVVRIYNAIAERDAKGDLQHAYYHPGVGTDGTWWDRVVGGGTGAGLDRNIKSAYRELCGDYWQSGTDTFLFGFSRGAYTVRSLGGLVARCGLIDTANLNEPEIWSQIERVFQFGYRRRSERRDDWDAAGYRFRNPGDKPFRFVSSASGTPSVPLAFRATWRC